jgi:hypothetical protein
MNQEESAVRRKINQQHKTKNVVITIIVMIGLFIGIGAWYNNTFYNSTFQNNFMSKCETGASASGCGCAYGVLQAGYSYSQAKQMDSDSTAGISSPDIQSWTESVKSQCGSS